VNAVTKRTTGYACVIMLATVAGPAMSARSAEAPTDSASQLEEIIVTAQKRAESVQSVPMSITALTGQDIERQGAMSFQDIASSVPSLAFRSSGPGRQKLNLRGISSGGGVSSTVGYYLDETAISTVSSISGTSFQQTNIDPDLFDIERIEILKGPQGTLYGSSSMGGTVKIVTKQPNRERTEAKFNVQGSGTAHGGGNYETNAALSFPIVEDKLAFRVSASRRAYDGYINRLVGNFEDGGIVSGPPSNPTQPGASALSDVTLPSRNGTGPIQVAKDVNTENVTGIRAALRWQVNSAFYIQPAIFWQLSTLGGKSSFDTIPGSLDQRRAFDIPEPYKDRFTVSSVTAAYELPAFTVLSASGFSDRSITNVEDFTDINSFAFGYNNLNDSNFLPAQRVLNSTGKLVDLGNLFSNNLFPSTVQPYPAYETEQNRARDFTQEFRLSSNGEGKLTWTAGVFYKNVKSQNSGFYAVPGYTAHFPLYAELGQFVFGPGGWPWGDLLAQNAYDSRLRETSEFGQLTYKITDQLALTLGERHYDYSYSFEKNNAGLFFGGGTALSGHPITGSAKGIGNNPKGLLSYSFNEDSQLYVTASKGFRIGAGNAPVPAARCAGDLAAIGRTAAPGQYNPDSLWNYEVGSKNRLFDDRMTVNLALYDIEWTNVQQQISLPVCGFSYTDNGGRARSRGLELEIDGKPARFLRVSGGVGYTDAMITSAAPGTGLHTGDRLLDVPKLTADAAAETTFRAFLETDAYARISWSYTGESLDTYFDPVKPAYQLTNARLGLKRDRWEGSLFANNLFDERPIFTRVDTLAELVPTFRRAVVGRPRTVGISLTWNY
jgi:iron complex outermembrane recepter protein